jgi:hypothetical protein
MGLQRNRSLTIAVSVSATALIVAGCGSAASAPTATSSTAATVASTAAASATADASGTGTAAGIGRAYSAGVTPADFPNPTRIDNRYFPLIPGTRYIYEGTSEDGQERIVKEVTRDTKTVMGIDTVVQRDYVTLDGTLIEDTYDWFAQDKDGNVWYFGEATTALDEKTGKLTDTKGAWEAGVDGAQPGIVMKARPAIGDSYRQEYLKGQAEDEAAVLRTGESITTKAGAFSDAIRLKDFTALDTAVVEEKLYAPGVGFVFVEHVKGPPEKIELVAIEKF